MKIDSAGSEWTQDVSATYTPNTNNQVFNSGNGNLENRLLFICSNELPEKTFQWRDH